MGKICSQNILARISVNTSLGEYLIFNTLLGIHRVSVDTYCSSDWLLILPRSHYVWKDRFFCAVRITENLQKLLLICGFDRVKNGSYGKFNIF